jgi:hypothetical protein
MKKALFIFVLLALPLIAFSQNSPREILHGKIVADSLKVNDVTVYNLSSRIGARTDNKGEFTLYARATDTLFFSSITFRSVHLVLKPSDMLLETLVIKLDVNVTMLDEVVINPIVLTGDLAGDSKAKKIKTIGAGFDANALIRTAPPKYTETNTAIPQQESYLQGINFVKLYNNIFKKKKKKDRGDVAGGTTDKPFYQAAKELFTYHFFTETLKIPHGQIDTFLIYADPGADAARLLDPKNEFELTDYLIVKGKEYLEKDK